MLSRNDNPNIPGFNFSTESVFNALMVIPASSAPPITGDFLLLDNSNFLLLDGTDLLLLG